MRLYKVALLSFLLVIVLATLWRIVPILESRFASVPKTVVPRGELSRLERSNIEIFEKSKDSVVYISTLKQVVDIWSMTLFDVPKGTGSGFVWDSFGHIVTNYHVIQGASRAMVRLSNGRDYEAVLVGADPDHDLAVLKIDPVPGVMKPVSLGSSSDLRVGQIVYAIGNPFGLDWTMTMGIISATDRVIHEPNEVKIKNVIQTDAAINPGNSGGPLLDSAGRVIGVNTAIYSPSGANAGIGFALPIDLVNRVVSSLISYGYYKKLTLGIKSDERLNRLLKRKFGISGVAVLGVEPDSIAAMADIKPARIYSDGSIEFGDIIIAVDSIRVSSLNDLEELLSKKSPGDKIVLSLKRGSERVDIELRMP